MANVTALHPGVLILFSLNSQSRVSEGNLEDSIKSNCILVLNVCSCLLLPFMSVCVCVCVCCNQLINTFEELIVTHSFWINFPICSLPPSLLPYKLIHTNKALLPWFNYHLTCTWWVYVVFYLVSITGDSIIKDMLLGSSSQWELLSWGWSQNAVPSVWMGPSRATRHFHQCQSFCLTSLSTLLLL